MAGKSTTEIDIRQNELLTVKEVASYLRVGRVTVWRWCKEGIIPAWQVGRTWRIPRDEFLNLLETEHPFEPDPSPRATASDQETPASPTGED
jgi:excisionase family DNA binding protein